MAVRFAFDEVVPGENQPSTSKRYDSFLEMFDCGPARRGIAAHCAPDSRNQSPKQAARNCFGDRFLLVLLVTVVDARSQTSISQPVSLGAKTGRQQDRGSEWAITGDLHQEDHLVDLSFLGFQLDDDLQVELYLETSQCGELLCVPRGLVLVG